MPTPSVRQAFAIARAVERRRRGGRTTEDAETRRKKREAAQAAAAERASRKRWYIQLNLRPAPKHINRFGNLDYTKHVWPKLFLSEEDAWAHARSTPAIWNPPPGIRRVISYSVQATYLPKERSE